MVEGRDQSGANEKGREGGEGEVDRGRDCWPGLAG